MDESGHRDASTPRNRGVLRRPWGSALAMIGLIVAFFLVREHWTHLAGLWIYLLLLACPLMHLFHGHGGHGRHGAPFERERKE
ncbi:MAG: DUF2933 domain-containing protein [Burkholderiaceae bacterium]|nr:DUF2933 domain-containing protein [Burkholderiaceae bacterium]